MMAGPKLPVSARSDPVGIRDQVASILDYWVRLSGERPGDEKSYGPFLTLLQQKGTLKTDEATERFFRVATEVVIEACLKNARPPAQQPDQEEQSENALLIKSARSIISYVVVDAYVKLLVLLIKSVNTGNLAEATTARLSLLNKVLSTIVRALLQDVEAHKVQPELPPFDQRPYFRLLLGLLQDFNTPDRVLDSSNLQVLAAFASAFHVLQPVAAPSFAFAWLELISHRMFMPTLLLARHQKGWMLMHRLIIDLLCFMEPRLRRFELGDAVRALYRGMLRVLLVLLHDFPEFLCEYHFSLCDVIPPCCIQLRNLVLSAFPRSMRLPDPFTPNLKVDLLPEIGQPPRILSNFTTALVNINLRSDLDKYLQTRTNNQFLLDLPNRLRLPANETARAGSQHNVPAISALVVYVGHMAINQMQSKPANITHSAPMDVFQHLSGSLDSEARYFFLNAIANQLRYPNNHTHYFSCVLLFLFAEASTEEVREQITRILLERLIVHRPHPWGLLITFIELIKNPRYDFWSHRFTHCAPELERVFESVARSCMAPGGQVPGEGVLEGGEAGLQQAQ
jgi:CCR4-NOT transcription complex subunit 1